jgi:hypothetical protein
MKICDKYAIMQPGAYKNSLKLTCISITYFNHLLPVKSGLRHQLCIFNNGFSKLLQSVIIIF